MEVQVNRVRIPAVLTLLAAGALALPTYTGYSGAPGTSGTCAASCHGTPGGTIEVVGFPATYELSRTYVVSIFHNGGSAIANFNASVRVGTGSQTAGTITAGYLTGTYSTGGEPNGVHLSSSDQDSCTFNWQAPDSGIGDVKLCLAGLQGSIDGPNTEIVLTASQAPGISQGRTLPPSAFGLRIEPTVTSGPIHVLMTMPTGSAATLRVTDRTGLIVARIKVPSASQSERTMVWSPVDRKGRRLAAGTYFVTLSVSDQRLTGKFFIR
jgi:hypothetical protein